MCRSQDLFSIIFYLYAQLLEDQQLAAFFVRKKVSELTLLCNALILQALLMCLICVQFDGNVIFMRPVEVFPHLIHKVIHRFCG